MRRWFSRRCVAADYCSATGVRSTTPSVSSFRLVTTSSSSVSRDDVVRRNPVGVDISSLPNGVAGGTELSSRSTQRLRGRAQAVRVKGKLAFIHLRQPLNHSVQVVVNAKDNDDLLNVVKSITPESVIDVHGTVHAVPKPVSSVTCSTHELHASQVDIVSLAATPLPFPIADENTKLDTRLDHRVIDLRTNAMGAVARLLSVANNAFRNFVLALNFVEIHTPKMIGTPSEGGSAIFALEYFDKKAFLAQSPQLYKQMMLMGDTTPGVFEIGPVFRAEKSLTHRHLTEFVGLDAEMIIDSHYTEVLNVLEGTLVSILRALEAETQLTKLATSSMTTQPEPIVATMAPEVMVALGVGEYDSQTPSTDTYGGYVGRRDGPFPVLRMSFDNAVKLMMDESILTSFVDDFNTAQEKQLGAAIKKRYGVDVYVIDAFPRSARPFYTMPSPQNAERTCSYDMYLRGEEICSGAQRIHDATLLNERIRECGIDPALIKDYVNAFRFGAWPHGGFGLGLERIVMFYLGLPDIRMVSLFPRDPRRITP